MRNLFLYGQDDLHDDVHRHGYRGGDLFYLNGLCCNLAQEKDST